MLLSLSLGDTGLCFLESDIHLVFSVDNHFRVEVVLLVRTRKKRLLKQFCMNFRISFDAPWMKSFDNPLTPRCIEGFCDIDENCKAISDSKSMRLSNVDLFCWKPLCSCIKRFLSSNVHNSLIYDLFFGLSMSMFVENLIFFLGIYWCYVFQQGEWYSKLWQLLLYLLQWAWWFKLKIYLLVAQSFTRLLSLE